jgi:hypothetical protein
MRAVDVGLINGTNSANNSVVFTSSNVTTFTYIGDALGLPIVINDISNYFDGSTNTFPIKVDQDYINTIADSKNLTVTVNGQQLPPYVKEQTWPWIREYDSFKGFRVMTSNVIIYNTPDPGDTAVVMITSNRTSVQTRKYPYSAATIALGD